MAAKAEAHRTTVSATANQRFMPTTIGPKTMKDKRNVLHRPCSIPTTMLDTRRLLVLREVAAHGSVSGAADALGYTPSAVSQQLGQLERETGRTLIERHGRGIRLTDAAHQLLPHAHDVLAALERANAALVQTAAELTGSVRLASFPTATRALLPAKLAALRDRHPRLRVDLTELEPHESLPGARARPDRRRGRARVRPDRPRRGARPAPCGPPQRTGAACRARRPRRRCPARRLRRARLDPAARVDGLWRARPARMPRVRLRAAGRRRDRRLLVACALAAAGVGVALVPDLGVTPLTDLVLRPLRPSLERRIFIAARAGSDDHPLIRAVVDSLT